MLHHFHTPIVHAICHSSSIIATLYRHFRCRVTSGNHHLLVGEFLGMLPEGGVDADAESSVKGETAQLLVDGDRERTMLVGVNSNSSSGGRESKQRLWTTIRKRVPIITVVKILVFMDMLSVALLMPLLPSYFKDLGISTESYGLMASAYSLAQIVGGLVLGTLSDRVMSRRSILLLSFVGSAISYGLVALSRSLSMLLLGRVIVGLVKQTMTIATAIVTENTTATERATELSRLTAATTFSLIVAPSMGSALYGYNKTLPPLVSSLLFVVNAMIALFFVPCDSRGSHTMAKKADDGGSGQFTANMKQACRDGPTLHILAARLIYGFLMRSLTAQNFLGYYEERFNVDTAVTGHLMSYRAALAFFVQLYALKPLKTLGSDVILSWFAIGMFTLANVTEAFPAMCGLWVFVGFVVPATVVGNSVLSACAESIFTQRVPKSDLGAALGTMNVLLSASGVVGPVYGAFLVGRVGLLRRTAVLAVHFLAFFVLWWAMEIRGRREGRRKVLRGVNGAGVGKRDGAANGKATAGGALTGGRPKVD